MKRIIFATAIALSLTTHANASPEPNVHGFFNRATDVAAIAPERSRAKRQRYTKTAGQYSSGTIAKPQGYVRGRLTCAVNVNRALAQRGVRGTGSAMAKSFLSWGSRSSVPVPGGVAVYTRGGRNGHVALVASADGMCWNPSSSRQAWRLSPCRASNFIGYRAA